ncbi:MAG: hypothetical protein GC185_04395 [Alphaproteobacteria bacterium]|nr:hypothetical protein [Alphaproteobacteria bacterium]
MSQALMTIDGSVTQPGILIATATLTAYMTLARTAFQDVIDQKIKEVTKNQTGWWDTFWYYNLLPAMKDMTAQWNTMDQQHSGTMGRFADVTDANRTTRAFENYQLETHREQRPAASTCTGAAAAGGMTRADAFRRAYAAEAPAEKHKRTSNAKGSDAAQGTGQALAAAWKDYKTKYCDPDYNAGASGCTAAGTEVNRDLDVAGEVFQKDTVDLTDTATKDATDALIQNIADPHATDPIMPSALTNSTGRQSMLRSRAYQARRQTVYDALYFIIANRAPGSNLKDFVAAMRGAAGYDPSTISQNPSHNELMQVMMADRFRSGSYAFHQVDEPENNEREAVIQQAFQTMQLSDELDLLDRYALVLAASAGQQINREGPTHTSGSPSDRPMK